LNIALNHNEIIARCVQGEAEAQRQLYNLYARQMFAVSLRLLNHREDAEDILQESFISAFNGIQTYRSESSFGSWLKRIVINKSLNYLNKRKIDFSPLDSDYLEEEVEIPAKGLTTDLIHTLLSELSTGYRLVFSLYYFENMTHKEIARQLNIVEGTSKSQLNRAKQQLKQKLIEQGYGK
jgi:RNA polymerase sigma factor (sigma-70 family)